MSRWTRPCCASLLVILAGCGRLFFDPLGGADAAAPDDTGVDIDTHVPEAGAPDAVALDDTGVVPLPDTAVICPSGTACTPELYPCYAGTIFCEGATAYCERGVAVPPGTDCGSEGVCDANGLCDRSPVQVVRPPGIDANDRAGFSVAIEGDRAAIGARGFDGGGVFFSGGVFIMNRTAPGTWALEAVLVADDPEIDAQLGSSVALQGDRVLAGAQYASGPTVSSSGAVYVFARSPVGTWTQTQKVSFDGGGSVGGAIALQGTRAVVGAETDSGAGALAGAAHVLELGDSWAAVARLTDPAGSRYGHSVALDGDLIAVGSPFENGGVVHLYRNDAAGAGWVDDGSITPPEPQGSSLVFGSALALAEGRLVVGALGYQHAGERETGIAYVFEREGTIWNLVGTLEEPIPQRDAGFGRGLAMRGDAVLVTAFSFVPPQLNVHHFRRTFDGRWFRTAELGDASMDYADGEAVSGIISDLQVAWSGNVAIVGMPQLATAGATTGGFLELDTTGL